MWVVRSLRYRSLHAVADPHSEEPLCHSKTFLTLTARANLNQG
jgi:hypothetical protein